MHLLFFLSQLTFATANLGYVSDIPQIQLKPTVSAGLVAYASAHEYGCDLSWDQNTVELSLRNEIDNGILESVWLRQFMPRFECLIGLEYDYKRRYSVADTETSYPDFFLGGIFHPTDWIAVESRFTNKRTLLIEAGTVVPVGKVAQFEALVNTDRELEFGVNLAFRKLTLGVHWNNQFGVGVGFEFEFANR